MRDGVGVGGVFSLEYVRPDGTPGWRVEIANAWTTVGLNYLLELAFRSADTAAAATSIWSAGLIDDLGFVGVSAEDQLRFHPGWVEFRQVYQARPGIASRAIQLFGPAGGGSICSDQPATIALTSGSTTITLPNSSGQIDIVGDGTLRGAFLADGQYIGQGTVLVCTAILPPTAAGLAVQKGGRLRISYTLRARDVPNPTAPVLDGNTMRYTTQAELVAATGGDLASTGEERTGVVYYSTAVGVRQPFAAGVTTATFVLYSNTAQAGAATTIYDKVSLATTVGVAHRRRTLIDGRPDLIATGLYRR